MSRLIKKHAVIVAVMLVVSCFVFIPCGQASAKTAQMKLPTKVVLQVKKDGKWVTDRVIINKYNSKGDLTEIKGLFPESKLTLTGKYNYKKGTKQKAAFSRKYMGEKLFFNFTFDGSGRTKKLRFYDCSPTWVDEYPATHNFKYGKKGYLSNDYWNIEEDEGWTTGTIRYMTKLKKGNATRIDLKCGKYGETRKYNKSGLLTYQSVHTPNGKGTSKFTYKMNGAYVKERYETTSDGKKLVWKYYYGKAKARSSRYYKTINLDERTIAGFIYGDILGNYDKNVGNTLKYSFRSMGTLGELPGKYHSADNTD